MPKAIKERTSLHDNVDDKLISPEIKAMQDMYIMPLLGSTLMNKLQSDIAATGTTTGNYKTLLDDYILDCLCNYVLSAMPDVLGFQFYNKGVGGKKADADTQPSMSDMYSIIAKYKSRAEHYAKRCRMYLIANAPTMFPEYNVLVAGIDVVAPERNTYTCPIYLGDENEALPGDYSLQKNRMPPNYNDPYYRNYEQEY
jgi:hypothetical protein